MKVLHVLHNHPPEFFGGVERYVVQTAAAQRRLGLDPSVLAGSEVPGGAPALEDEDWEGIRVLRLRRGPGFRTPIDPFDAATPSLYEEALRRARPDLVHVHHWWNLGSDLVRRAAARGVPAVVTLHDYFATCSLFFRLPDQRTPCAREQGAESCGPCVGERFLPDAAEVRWLLELRNREFAAELAAAAAVLAPSHSHAARLARHLDPAAGRRIRALPLGSPPIEPLPPRGTAFPSGRLRVLHFGNLSRLKGVELLVRAVDLADPEGSRIELVLAGDQVERGLPVGRARLAGRYEVEDLRRLAAEADIAVFPSFALESYGLVVDEALRLGLPVVVSDRGALAERVGGRGVAVPVEGPEALAAVLRGFLDEPARLEAFRRAPRPVLADPAAHAAGLRAVYEEAAAAARPAVDIEGPMLRRLGRASERVREVLSLMAAHRPPAGGAEEVTVEGPGRRLTDATTSTRPRVAAVEPDRSGRLVTVITRTRNRPELLREAVASVAAQEHRDVELVIVNDGGCDVSAVLEPFRDRLAIRCLEPGRVGRCRAGNLALEHARGTWIAWLDDDDLHYPGHLRTLVAALEASGKKVGYTDAHRIDQERDGADGAWREVGRSVPYSEDFSRVMLFRQAYIHLVTVMFHRECWERLGGFDESLEVLEDWDLFFRLAQDYDFLHVPEVTAAFRIRNDGSNAVTALRQEFVDTRTRLFARYVHLAFPEMLGMLDQGTKVLGAVLGRVAALEAGVQELRRKAGREGVP